jgi:hypothetical protein
MIKTILMRAARSFIAAALAGIAAQLSVGVTIHSVEDLKKLAISLAVASLTAGLLALDKLIRYEPTGQN